MIRVLVVDDEELMRGGLRSALEVEADLEVVGEAGDAEQAVDQATLLRPDVVLMDVRMGSVSGIEACRQIRHVLPEVSVLMLTSHSEDETVSSALLAGATGYLLKNVRREDLLKAIRAVAEGKSLLDPSVTAPVLKRMRELEQREDPLVASLSSREKQVLCLVAKGMTNKEIGERLFIAETTARNHLQRVNERLGLSRRSETAAFAVQHGLDSDDLLGD